MSTAEPVTFLGHPVADWIDRLSDSDPLLRRLAAHALGMIGPQAREARDALTATLEDEQGFVRVWAAAALAQVDRKKASAAVRALLAGLEDPQYFVRSLAAWHLGRLDPTVPGLRAALPKLQVVLSDPDLSVRREASEALKRLQSRRPGGEPA